MTDFYAGVPGLQVTNPIPSPGYVLLYLCRVLHMKDETLALAYAYFKRCLKATIPPKTSPAPWIDAHTFALTCLNLAAKMTDVPPQQLPMILVASWRLLRRGAQSPFPPWDQCSSSRLAGCPLFCSLRNAIDAAETFVLRVLAFNIHFDTPVQYDQMYLTRALLVAGAKSQKPNEDNSNPTPRDGVKLEPQLEEGEDNGTEAPQHGGNSNPTAWDGVKLEPQLEEGEDNGTEAPQHGGNSNPTTWDGVKLEPQLEEGEDNGTEAPQHGEDKWGRTLIENLPTHIKQQIRGLSQRIRGLSLEACVLSRRAPHISALHLLSAS
ncbi:hypothetical protein IWX90DRAFT_164433 [Phyllosticta citrichinensis]|uniref:Cyclin N-terminal domain-containing protein n=1 Tax=Phyllosticta citrichinensis TaxID=1130410 RepID=A0ABR1Y0K8_9PEZI